MGRSGQVRTHWRWSSVGIKLKERRAYQQRSLGRLAASLGVNVFWFVLPWALLYVCYVVLVLTMTLSSRLRRGRSFRLTISEIPARQNSERSVAPLRRSDDHPDRMLTYPAGLARAVQLSEVTLRTDADFDAKSVRTRVGCRSAASNARPSLRRGPGREKYALASTA